MNKNTYFCPLKTSSMNKKNRQNNYSAASIQVLEFPHSVRARPGMYMGSQDEDGLLQTWEEAIANAAWQVNESTENIGARRLLAGLLVGMVRGIFH